MSLEEGLCGIVKRISTKGYAVIQFKGMDKVQGVAKADFHKLEKTEVMATLVLMRSYSQLMGFIKGVLS